MNDRPEPFDATTGEIITPGVMRAADGGIVPAAAGSMGEVLDMLEDRRFSAEALQKVQNLGRMLRERNAQTEKPVKGKVTITLEMEADGDFFRVTPEITVKEPKIPRPRSVMWQDEDTGTFTRFPAKQMQMFGLTPGGPARPMRNVS